MVSFSPETLKQIALDFFGYHIGDESAANVAKTSSALLTDLRAMAAVDLTGIEPAFSFVTMRSEADRVRQRLAAR